MLILTTVVVVIFVFYSIADRTKIVFGAPYTMLANTFFSARACIVWW